MELEWIHLERNMESRLVNGPMQERGATGNPPVAI
jgi:hypothetical protein